MAEPEVFAFRELRFGDVCTLHSVLDCPRCGT